MLIEKDFIIATGQNLMKIKLEISDFPIYFHNSLPLFSDVQGFCCLNGFIYYFNIFYNQFYLKFIEHLNRAITFYHHQIMFVRNIK